MENIQKINLEKEPISFHEIHDPLHELENTHINLLSVS